ncbi:hypothetical protein G9A89_017857 [Geosiphon pyriformis]|nr:hypothetical protein G9A89_017857 [Geosiphon pyriformis]
MRRTETSEKILIENKDLLGLLADSAYHASEAACLDGKSKTLARLLYVDIEKDLNPIGDTSQKFVIKFRATELKYFSWFKDPTAWTAIQYKHVAGTLVEKKYYNIWQNAQKHFWSKMKILESQKGFLDRKSLFSFVAFGRGGIYAIFAALEFANKHAVKPIVVTFGMPSIGNMEFVSFAYSQIEHYRVTYGDDYVPQFPRFGIRHDNMEEKYVPMSTEYWIPLQPDQCQCSPAFTIVDSSELNYPKIYRCNQIGSLNPNPVCNANFAYRRYLDHRSFKKPNQDDHFGPYFGYIMDKCPQ